MGIAATAEIWVIEPRQLLRNAFSFRRVETVKAPIELRIASLSWGIKMGEIYSTPVKDMLLGKVEF
jgi:hypothetical protein